MEFARRRVSIAPGDGLACRNGGSLLLIRSATPGQRPLLDALLAAASQPDALSGSGLLRLATTWITRAGQSDVPDLCLLTSSPDGIHLLLAGAAEAEVEVDGAAEWHSGRDAAGHADRALAGEIGKVQLRLPSAAAVEARSNLQAGVVPASAVSIGLQAATAPVTEAPAAVPEPAPTTPVDGQVLGVCCPNGHFTDPQAACCLRCQTPVDPSAPRFLGTRPALGVLVDERESSHQLTRDLVLGRDPASSEEVQQGDAIGVPLDDPGLSTSRVHARILLDGWRILIVDANSANGTYIGMPGEEWQRLEPERPTPVGPRTNIAIGGRRLRISAPS